MKNTNDTREVFVSWLLGCLFALAICWVVSRWKF